MMPRRKYIIYISVAIMLIVIVYFSSFYHGPDDYGTSDFTALEGLPVAESKASEINESATLIIAKKGNNYYMRDGRTYDESAWSYFFINGTDQQDLNLTQIIVYKNSTYEILFSHNYNAQLGGINPVPSEREIVNWSIDSDDVIEILLEDDEFAEFADNNPDMTIEAMQITTSGPGYGYQNPVWAIEFHGWYGEFPIPDSMYSTYGHVVVDATNGEILVFHGYGEKKMEICPPIIIIILLIFIIWISIKIVDDKRRNKKPDKKLEEMNK